MPCTLNSIQGYSNAWNKSKASEIYLWNGMFNLSKTSFYKENTYTKKKKEKSTKRKKPNVNVWNESSWVRVKIGPQKGFWNLASKLELEKLGFSISPYHESSTSRESDDFINEAKFCNTPMAQKGDEKNPSKDIPLCHCCSIYCLCHKQTFHDTFCNLTKVSELVRHNFQFLPPCTYLENCDYPREGTQHHNYAPRNTKKFGYRKKYIHQESRQFKLEEEELGVWMASWCT